MNSIQRRLSLSLIAVLIIVGLLLTQISLWLFDEGLRRYLENNLRQETQNLLGALTRNTDEIVLDEARVTANFERPFSGYYFLIEMPEQQWRSRSSWDHALAMPAVSGLQTQLGDGPQDQRLLVFRADYRRFGNPIRIVVAQDYTPMLSSFRRVQWIGVGLGLVALLSVLICQRILVTRALRPLENIRQQIEQLQHGQRSSLDIHVPDELAPLVDQINHLLSHTEQTLTRSRHALGNLGHALKTPLSVLFSISARDELLGHPELRENLQIQLHAIQERLSRELGRARLAGEALPGAHFDCAKELPDLFSTLAQIHQRNLRLKWHAPDNLRLPWDREDLLELFGNLLDNACKWATSTATLTIEKIAKGYNLHVDDDGPGVDAEKRNEVINRGTRIDERVAGHGLGLGIVRDIVDHCGGELLLEQSPLGGLRVVIYLPDPN